MAFQQSGEQDSFRHMLKSSAGMHEMECNQDQLPFTNQGLLRLVIKWSCMEHCFHVWAGAPCCYLELLDKLQKQYAGLLVLNLLPLLKPWVTV